MILFLWSGTHNIWGNSYIGPLWQGFEWTPMCLWWSLLWTTT